MIHYFNRQELYYAYGVLCALTTILIYARPFVWGLTDNPNETLLLVGGAFTAGMSIVFIFLAYCMEEVEVKKSQRDKLPLAISQGIKEALTLEGECS